MPVCVGLWLCGSVQDNRVVLTDLIEQCAALRVAGAFCLSVCVCGCWITEDSFILADPQVGELERGVIVGQAPFIQSPL